MDRFHEMAVFVAVAEEEGFAGGARRLGLSPPAVTRAIAGLEERLGARLFTRTTRHVRLTEAGQRYLEQVRPVLQAVEDADQAAAGQHGAPRGQLTVTAPVMFGRLYVMPGIVDYLARYPEVRVSALLVDRTVNLLEEGMDVGVRIGPLADSTMRAIPVGWVRRLVCASPAYWRGQGEPVTPAELAGHSLISASGVSSQREWGFVVSGKPVGVSVRPRLTVTSNDAAIQAALQGVGATRLMSYQVAPYLASGQLRAVLMDCAPPPAPIHVLHLEGRQASAKVRACVDLLVERLRADPALRQAS